MGSQVPMTISTFVRTAPKMPAQSSILLRGPHGIGKSQVIRLVAAEIAKSENIKNYRVIDRRLSQMSEGDMIGLPSTDGEVTRFNPPDWYKRACEAPCVLLLDELNRATPEVMQAAFQIVLDRELNGWKLHEQTRVFAAINASAEYTVNEVDPALLDRFWCVDLTPDVKDWLKWAKSKNTSKPCGLNVVYFVADFIQQNDKWLDPPKTVNPGDVHVSRRSWERLSDTLEHAGLADEEKANDDMFYPLCIGFLGIEATSAFQSFVKNIDNQVSGKDIIDNWAKTQAKVQRLGQERLNIAIEKVSEYVVKKLTTLTPKQGKNLKAFMDHLPHELRIVCWSKLTQEGIDKIELAKSIHKYCAESVLDVFGVPMGEAGIGVIPNIPGIFKDDKK